MAELSQIAAQIAYGPIQEMLKERRIWTAALFARGGWMALPLQVVVFGKAG